MRGKLGFNIHNYFFAKALDQVRPGGVVAFVTSRYTMDSQNPSVRKHLAQRADLLGAIRLPNTAFKANAGTEVVSDILFLQRRDRVMDIEPDWVHLGQTEDGYAINSYFLDHPEMVMGKNSSESTAHGMDYTVEPLEDISLADQLHEAVRHIHGTYQEAELPDLGEGETIQNTIPADPDVKNFSYTLVDGEIYFRENSIMVRPELNNTAKERVKGMIGLKTCVRQLIDLQMDEFSPENSIQQKQAELNTLYDSFTEKYGILNSRGNRLAFSDDSAYYLLCALEILDDDGNFQGKADMFSKRTIQPHKVVTSVDTAVEALTISIGERACVDLGYMSSLSGKPTDALATDLKGIIFHDPKLGTLEDLTGWVTADEYLSGNVRQTLKDAETAAAENPMYRSNVDALRAAQPKDLEASEIEVRLGATWIDKAYIQQFMYELLEERNTALYQKMFAEQESFRDWLKGQPPEEILNHAYEYTIREDILLSLEYHDLSDAQINALMNSPSPLADVFKDFEKLETDHMDTVWDCLENRADAILEEQRRVLREMPVYTQSGTYAHEHGELEQYRASNEANMACKQAVEDAIRDHYSGYSLDGKAAVAEVVNAFGIERTMYILANTVQQKDHDGRISPSNKEWAKSIPIQKNPDAWGGDRNVYLIVNSHPGLTDLFVSAFRKELCRQQEKTVKPSVLDKLQRQPIKNSPKISANFHGQER